MRQASSLLAAVLVVVLGIACDRSVDRDTGPVSSSAGDLVPIPMPDLAASEPAVRDQLTAAREALDGMLDETTEPAAQARSFGRMGQLYHAYDLLESADACYRNARQLAPDDSRWSYLNGLVYERQGRLEEAAEILNSALDINPRDAATLLHLGRVHLARNELDIARSFFERALALEPTCHAARFGMGEVARGEGNLDTAAEIFARVLDDQPGAEQVHYPLAQVLLRLGRRDEGQEHLDHVADRALKVGGRPYCPDPLDLELADLRTGTAAAVRRGLILGLAGEGGQEVDLLRQAVEAAPDDPMAHQRLGGILLQHGDYEGAVVELSAAAQLDPENPENHSNLGVAMIRQGKLGQAADRFRTALEIRPDSIYYLFQLATTVQRQGRCEDAIELFGRILDAEPAHRHSLLQRALCLTSLGRLAEAGEDMSVLLDVHPPQDPAERLRLASMLLSLGEDQRALRHFEMIAASDAPAPVRARSHILIGQVGLRRGDSAAAERSFQQAVELDPSLLQAPELQQLATPPGR